MSLFRKKQSPDAAADDGSPEAAVPPETVGEDGAVQPTTGGTVTTGPFDLLDALEDRPRLDFGSIRVPAVDGMEVRVETADDGRVMGIGLVVSGTVLQVQPFAAPRSAGIWDEVRGDLRTSLTAQGGSVEETTGPFGPELRARLPVKRPDGSTSQEPARFLGVDGPRWFLRGVISGAGAVDPQRASVVEEMFAGVVVVRGDQAAPPREPLPLTLPEGPVAAAGAGDDQEPSP